MNFEQIANALKAFEAKVTEQLAEKGAAAELQSQDEKGFVSTYFWNRYSPALTATRIVEMRAVAA